MNEVKRYMFPFVTVRPDLADRCFPKGMTVTHAEMRDFVLATDYATLEAENAKLRAELERRAVQDGWKLVPVEPTPEMLDEIHLIEAFSRTALATRYAAMLAAAPSAPKADDRPLYTCIGKGGEYRYLGTAIGAGDSRGELAEVEK